MHDLAESALSGGQRASPMRLGRPSIVRVTRVPDVLDSLTPVGTEVPAGLEAACAVPGVRAFTSPTDPEVTLLVPADDEPDPEVTLLVPAVNERITIEEFVAWCHEGLAAAGVEGRDPDRRQLRPTTTPELAVEAGARVLHTPLRGLGRAYIDAIPYVRGRYVIMGDADCTYDFRKLAPFVEAMRSGTEYAMGSRWKGSHREGRDAARCTSTSARRSRPGSSTGSTAATSPTSTAACAASPATRCSGWASCPSPGSTPPRWCSSRSGWSCVTTEVPVTFLKDQEGRLSHHKRSGWFSPFAAAWINLRAMFIHGAEFFLFKPGIVLLGARAAAVAAPGASATSPSAPSPSASTRCCVGRRARR